MLRYRKNRSISLCNNDIGEEFMFEIAGLYGLGNRWPKNTVGDVQLRDEGLDVAWRQGLAFGTRRTEISPNEHLILFDE